MRSGLACRGYRSFHSSLSIFNDNAMNVFHGYLHKNLAEGWFDPVLTNLTQTETAWLGRLSNFLIYLKTVRGATLQEVIVSQKCHHKNSPIATVILIFTVASKVFSLFMWFPVIQSDGNSHVIRFVFKLGLPKWLIKPFRCLC